MIWVAIIMLAAFSGAWLAAWQYRRKHPAKPPSPVRDFAVFVSPDGKQRIHIQARNRQTTQHYREKGWREE